MVCTLAHTNILVQVNLSLKALTDCVFDLNFTKFPLPEALLNCLQCSKFSNWLWLTCEKAMDRKNIWKNCFVKRKSPVL